MRGRKVRPPAPASRDPSTCQPIKMFRTQCLVDAINEPGPALASWLATKNERSVYCIGVCVHVGLNTVNEGALEVEEDRLVYGVQMSGPGGGRWVKNVRRRVMDDRSGTGSKRPSRPCAHASCVPT
jgi:hypothetical protein